MKFKVKDLDVTTGGTQVAIMHKKDAALLDLHTGDRLSISRGRKSTVAVLDIAESAKVVKPGHLGLLEEVIDKIGVKNRDNVHVTLDKKPASVALIKKKLNGKRLNREEIELLVQDIVNNRLTAVEITYFVSAGYVHGMDIDEIVNLTKAMIKTGDILQPCGKAIVDKHCIGGVPGNRTTMIVVPILVAAGYCVPKTSSRSITSPAGTADTMEVLSKVDLSMDDIKKVVQKVGGCMTWGGSVSLAPADDKIISVEHPLSIDAEGQLLASILAKKGSVSATHLLIDIPVGHGAKVKRIDKARRLRKLFEKVGHKLGMKVRVVITDGSQPIGNGIGPALEARDVMWVLKNDPKGPQDLLHKSLLLASEIMRVYPLNGWKARHGYYYAKKMLESGKAYEVMLNIIKAQGLKVADPDKIKLGKHQLNHIARKTGKVKHIENALVSRLAKIAGAPYDKGAGIYLYKHVGDKVKKGETICTIYAESKQKLNYAREHLSEFECIVVE